MPLAKGAILVDEFVLALNERSGVRVARTSISQNVFEFRGKGKCLMYIKGRAEAPYRWGITANVVERLKRQAQPWAVVLLFDCHESGYLLPASDVTYYIQTIWPLAGDGDYKPATGSYLGRNAPLYSLEKFVTGIERLGNV